MSSPATVFCEHAWLGGDRATAAVTLFVREGAIAEVRTGEGPPPGALRLRGLTLPGFTNAHSHAFHRALRGRSQRGAGDFWSWRAAMFALAERITPDRYLALARAAFAEMTLAGFTGVGEFHYLHHGPGGRRYADPNEMAGALVQAAAEAGIGLVLLDACYLLAGPGEPLAGAQARFGDSDPAAWAERAGELASKAPVPVGAAIHSLRAVPPAAAAEVAAWAAQRKVPLHVHCSEQRAENESVAAAYGASPVQLLERAGALGKGSVAVHATHVSDPDAGRLARSGTGVCLCPTTERDLGDGIGPARRLAELGAPLSIGTDSHAVVDPFEELRGVELDERLAGERRGIFAATQLLEAGGAGGRRALGDPLGGRIAAGSPADLVTISLMGVGLAGWSEANLLEAAVFSATSRDVTDVLVRGRQVVEGGRHLLVDDVPGALRRAIGDLWPD